MTSTGLADFKALLLATQEREREIRADISKARGQLALSWAARILTWASLVPVASKALRIRITSAVALRRTEIETLRRNLAASRLSISFDMETAVAEPHRRMLAAFDQLTASQRKWAVRYQQRIDRVKARSSAGTVISQKPAHLARRADTLVDTNDAPLALTIQNGAATAYFYPGFVLIVNTTRQDFAVIDLSEIGIAHLETRYTEAESVPTDALMLGKVWAKTNKNGTRDKRFKHNRELPVMLYGEVSLDGPGGLNEVFMFSRNDACRDFVSAVSSVQNILGAGRKRDRVGAEPAAVSSRL